MSEKLSELIKNQQEVLDLFKKQQEFTNEDAINLTNDEDEVYDSPPVTTESDDESVNDLTQQYAQTTIMTTPAPAIAADAIVDERNATVDYGFNSNVRMALSNFIAYVTTGQIIRPAVIDEMLPKLLRNIAFHINGASPSENPIEMANQSIKYSDYLTLYQYALNNRAAGSVAVLTTADMHQKYFTMYADCLMDAGAIYCPDSVYAVMVKEMDNVLEEHTAAYSALMAQFV